MGQIMHCPGCGTQMVAGRTVTEMNDRPKWLPQIRDVPAFFHYSKRYTGTDSLAGPVFLTRWSMKRLIYPAWYCTKCDLLLMDCKTELEEDFYTHSGVTAE